jgi:hypothetical protein
VGATTARGADRDGNRRAVADVIYLLIESGRIIDANSIDGRRLDID